jgi:hypothetical protein
MVIYNHFLLTFAESWYSQIDPPQSVDVVRCLQLPFPLDGCWTEAFQTISIDLGQSEADLLRAFSKTTRQEIRRAATDQFTHDLYLDASSCIQDFCTFFEQNDLVGNRGAEARRWVISQNMAGSLILSRILNNEGELLVWHAYFRDSLRARLKYSVSLFRPQQSSALRSLIGRANRLAHWQEMRALKEVGILVYDFGGWYTDCTDQKLLGVNRFKAGFGGVITTSYHCTYARTAKGKIYLWANYLRHKIQSLRRSRNAQSSSVQNYSSEPQP